MNLRWPALLGAMTLVLAACGTSAGANDGVATLEASTATTTAPLIAEEVDAETQMLAYAECLRDEGVDVEDPTLDDNGNIRPPRPVVAEGESFDRESMVAAREACAEFIEGFTFGFREGDITEFQDTLLQFAACMRENGYDMADPDLSSVGAGPGQGGGQGGRFGEIDRDDPDFQVAQEACQDILAGFGPGDGRLPGQGGER